MKKALIIVFSVIIIIGFLSTHLSAQCFIFKPLNHDNVSSDGGDFSVFVNDPSGLGYCGNWTIKSSDDTWLYITSIDIGTVYYTVKNNQNPNQSTIKRTGTLTIYDYNNKPDAIFTITQAGANVDTQTCSSYSFSFAEGPIGPSGGDGSVGVNASPGCGWKVKVGGNVGWLTTGSSGVSSGEGNGTVDYTVESNPDKDERIGILTLYDTTSTPYDTFTITQAGFTPDLSPLNGSFEYFGSNGSVAITSNVNDYNWTAISNNTDWIRITSGSSGSGPGKVDYFVTENPYTTSREGTITIAGKTFPVKQEGNGLPDTTAPSVGIDYPTDGSTTDLVFFIRGTLSDDDGPSSGIDYVEIRVSDGNGNYLGPDGNWSKTEEEQLWAKTSGAEVWWYDTGNVEWKNSMGYEVTAKVYDNAGYSGEKVISFTLQKNYKQLKSTLSLGVSSNAILLEDSIDVSGKLTPLPDDGTAISGNTINITITAPDGEVTSQSATTGPDGVYQIADISGFTQKGTYTIQASFSETTKMAASTSDEVSLQVSSFAGYAIIVEGKVSSDEGLDSHNKTTNNIYNALLERGFIKDNIYYFNYDVKQDVDNNGSIDDIDGVPLKVDIQYAIRKWAKDKMFGAPAPLYIILHDHGNTDTFYVYDDYGDDDTNDTITPFELNSWMDYLENGMPSPNDLQTKRIIIYGACYSGSFINVLSKKGRVIVTSAATNEESYKGPMGPDGIRSGSYFLEGFFKELERGYSIKNSFEIATGKTEIFTRKGGVSANTNNEYLDTAMQHPLLEDDGDGVGSNSLSGNVGDGQVVKDIYLGVGETLEELPESQAEILNVTETLHLSPFETNYLLWATVNNNAQVQVGSGSAWMEIRPPSQTLSETGDTGGSNQLSADYEKIPLLLEDSGNWEEQIDTSTESGLFEVFYFVSDKTTGETSAPMRSIVYKDSVGNNPSYTFSLVSPTPASEEKTSLIFRWDAATGPDEEDTTYTYNLLIATDEEFNNVVYKKEEIPTTAAIVDSVAGLSDLTIYYWKVQAVDAYGLTMDSKQTWPFYTNNTNFGFGFITGAVYDANSFAPIVGATVKTDFGDEDATKTEGYYIMSANEGAYTVTCSFNGYSDTSFSGISVSYGKTTEINIPMTSFVLPTPDIKANGSDGPVNINSNDNFSITVGLGPGGYTGAFADWYIAVNTPSGWQSFNMSQMDFSTSGIFAILQNYDLVSVGPTNIFSTSSLSAGTYTYYFGVDLVEGQLYYDSVVVNVQ